MSVLGAISGVACSVHVCVCVCVCVHPPGIESRNHKAWLHSIKNVHFTVHSAHCREEDVTVSSVLCRRILKDCSTVCVCLMLVDCVCLSDVGRLCVCLSDVGRLCVFV